MRPARSAHTGGAVRAPGLGLLPWRLLGFARRRVFDQSCPLQLLAETQDFVHIHIELDGDIGRGRITPLEVREHGGVLKIEIIQHPIPRHGLTLPPVYLWRNTRPAIVGSY
jgi:hypothetical protein